MHRREFSNVDFAYWVQGAIEIGEITTLSDKQVMMIRRRLNDIPKLDKFSGSVFLLLAMCTPQEAFDGINKELQKKFIHDIDPSYDGDQEFFNDVHSGKISKVE